MAILTTSGRTAMALAIMAQPVYLAWGAGSPTWDVTPVAEDPAAAALVAEVGRRAVTLAQYVTPDPAGSIIVPNGTFSPSATPTNNIYCRFNFDFTDSPTATIREAGIFVGTQIASGLPAGQTYFVPDDTANGGINDVTNPGTLLVLEHFPAFTRSSAVRQSFEYVITF